MQLTDSYGADQHFLWSVVTAIVLVAVVLMVAIMMVRLAGPRWERIVKRSPTLFAAGHFQIREQAGVKLGVKTMRIAIDSHESNRLPPVAERFLPFFSGALRHFGFTGVLVTRGPPLAGRRNLKFRAGQVNAAYLIVTRGKPEETLRPKDARKFALQ
ncbi:MAG: hypothetical protein QOJ45_1893 [Verrucomicrobiota bacterium]